jgi:hypothetical protein
LQPDKEQRVNPTFDRLDFIRAMRDKPGMPAETVEALADALHTQHTAADVVSTADMKAALTDLEQRLTIKGAAGLVLLGGFLAALKFFGGAA